VRGHWLGSHHPANSLPQRLSARGAVKMNNRVERPSIGNAVVTENPVSQRKRPAKVCLEAWAAQQALCRVLGLRSGCAATADRTGRLKRMRSFSRTTELADGSNPSPVRRRLVKAPSPDTLSPRERAIFPTLAPRCPAEDMGNDQPLGRGQRSYSLRFVIETIHYVPRRRSRTRDLQEPLSLGS